MRVCVCVCVYVWVCMCFGGQLKCEEMVSVMGACVCVCVCVLVCGRACVCASHILAADFTCRVYSVGKFH